MKFLQSLSAIFLLSVALTSTNLNAEHGVPDEGCAIFYAGQHIVAGSVCVTVGEDDNVFLDYIMENDWLLTEAHAWIGDSMANLPQTRAGNPRIGHFPHTVSGLSGVAYYGFNIPITDLLVTSETFCGNELIVAAHAVVKKQGHQSETAWAGTELINSKKKGSWATYFSFINECAVVRPTIVVSSDNLSLNVGETAKITFTLSEDSLDFDSGDVDVFGGTLSNFVGSGSSYTAIFTPTENSTADGVIHVPSDKFSNEDGTFNKDGDDLDNTVTITINTNPPGPGPWYLPPAPKGCVNTFARGATSFIDAGLADAGSSKGWIINPPAGNSDAFYTLTDGTNNYGRVQLVIGAGIQVGFDVGVTGKSYNLRQINAFVGNKGQFGISGLDSLNPANYGNQRVFSTGPEVAALFPAKPNGSLLDVVAYALVCGIDPPPGS